MTETEEITYDVPAGQFSRYAWIRDLQVGQGRRVPNSDFSPTTVDVGHNVRSVAGQWGKRLGRKFRTRKDQLGIWIIREA